MIKQFISVDFKAVSQKIAEDLVDELNNYFGDKFSLIYGETYRAEMSDTAPDFDEFDIYSGDVEEVIEGFVVKHDEDVLIDWSVNEDCEDERQGVIWTH